MIKQLSTATNSNQLTDLIKFQQFLDGREPEEEEDNPLINALIKHLAPEFSSLVGKKKMNENVEAELIDLILIEALEEHGERVVFEIDTTKMPIPACADVIEEVYAGIRTPSSGIVSWLAGLADEL